MRTMGSIFSGGGGWDIGGRHAGLTPKFAVELEPWIAQHHATVFGDHVINSSVWDVDYARLPRVNVLVSSPPCQATSKSGAQARSKRVNLGTQREEEGTVCDPTVGLATLKAVDGTRPDVVLVENNADYAHSATFKAIVQGLLERGYPFVDWRVLKAQDYGVASSRERLIMRASKRLLPPWPAPIQAPSWYRIIYDLISTMPVSPLANWQAKALRDNPAPLGVPLLIGGGNVSRNKRGYIVYRTPDKPSWTIQKQQNTGGMRVLDEHGITRQLTTRAVARLMGFPDDYQLPDLRTMSLHILGNSVPPTMAYHLLLPFAQSSEPSGVAWFWR